MHTQLFAHLASHGPGFLDCNHKGYFTNMPAAVGLRKPAGLPRVCLRWFMKRHLSNSRRVSVAEFV